MKEIKNGLPYFTLILIFVLTAFAVIYLRTEVVCMEYEISKLQVKKSTLYEEKKIIEAHLEKLNSCKNIEIVALGKLGMKLSNRENVYYLKKPSGNVTIARNIIMKKRIVK